MNDKTHSGAPDAVPGATSNANWRRWALLGGFAALAGLAIYQYGHFLSFETLSDNRAALLAWRDQNYGVAAASFMAAYFAVVAFSIPGALWMTLAGGFLFGLWPGAPMIILAATAGAVVIFLIARSSVGAALRERAGPWMRRIEDGFHKDAASYLLIMRLTPVVPFFVANIAPALFGVRASTFLWTTGLGIAPATVVYTWVGSGLGAALEAGDQAAVGDLGSVILQPSVLGPLLGLAALSALPIFLKRRRAAANAEASEEKAGA